MESPEEQALEDAVGAEMHGKPKGISVEKVSVMGKPGFDEQAEEAMEEAVPDKGMDEELTDEEIAELLKQLG
jgi:hypothetical protein